MCFFAIILYKSLSINIFSILFLDYKSILVESFTKQRQSALGEFLGTVIGGIYEGIRTEKFDGESDFFEVVKRTHKYLMEMINEFICQKD